MGHYGVDCDFVENVLLTLSSLLRTARAWGHACGDFRFADLTLPREGVNTEPRCSTRSRKSFSQGSIEGSTLTAETGFTKVFPYGGINIPNACVSALSASWSSVPNENSVCRAGWFP